MKSRNKNSKEFKRRRLKTDPSDQPIRSVSRRQIHQTSQSEAFPEDQTRFCLFQSDHSGRTYKTDASSYGPDYFFIQSDSFGGTSDGPSLSRPIISFGRTFGQTSYGPSLSCPITSFGRIIGRTSDGPSSSRPIKSFGVSSEKPSRDSCHSNGHGPHE